MRGRNYLLRGRKYLRTDLEVKQGDEPFVDFEKIAEELSPIVCANRHSSLVRRFVDRLPGYQRSKLGGDRQPCLLCRHVGCEFFVHRSIAWGLFKRNERHEISEEKFLRQFNGLSLQEWVRNPILVPKWIQFVHLATLFGRCLVRELQLL